MFLIDIIRELRRSPRARRILIWLGLAEPERARERAD